MTLPELIEKVRNLLPAFACLAVAAAHGGGKFLVAEMFASKFEGRDHGMFATDQGYADMSVRIAVANLKGGVGRSTTTLFLSETLAPFHGLKVLVVDLEPPLRTPAELVACLGGEQRLAQDYMVTPEAILDWIEKDFIPNGWHLRMFVRAVAAGRVFAQHGMDQIFSIAPEEMQAIADRVPWCLSTDPAPPKPVPYWERARIEPAEPRDDLAYRPAPMLLTARQKRTVSAELRQLMREREKLRLTFVNLQAAGDSGEDDALSDLNGANDDVLMFEPQSIADLAIIVAMVRHQIETAEIHEDFLEHLLSAVERLVLEQRSINRRGHAEKGGAR